MAGVATLALIVLPIPVSPPIAHVVNVNMVLDVTAPMSSHTLVSVKSVGY